VKLVDGMIEELEIPTNVFSADKEANLVFFIGAEPHLHWQAFADCVFKVANTVGVSRIIFMGSFGGTVPHTREPRLYGSVTRAQLKSTLTDNGVRLSDYQGPGSFATFLLSQAAGHGIDMLSIAAEIPGYLQGVNPLSIEAVTRRLAVLLNQPVNLDKLRRMSNEWEQQVSEAVEKDDKLAATIRKLEEDYDNELIGQAPAAREDGHDEAADEAEDGEDEHEHEEE
jgi:proteasome assembly chaperone (PAC2) family protein